MKTHCFEKNEATKCSCGNEKTAQEIYCGDCANYWSAMVDRFRLPFRNSNGSVDWMNEMHQRYFELDRERACNLIG